MLTLPRRILDGLISAYERSPIGKRRSNTLEVAVLPCRALL